MRVVSIWALLDDFIFWGSHQVSQLKAWMLKQKKVKKKQQQKTGNPWSVLWIFMTKQIIVEWREAPASKQRGGIICRANKAKCVSVIGRVSHRLCHCLTGQRWAHPTALFKECLLLCRGLAEVTDTKKDIFNSKRNKLDFFAMFYWKCLKYFLCHVLKQMLVPVQLWDSVSASSLWYCFTLAAFHAVTVQLTVTLVSFVMLPAA